MAIVKYWEPNIWFIIAKCRNLDDVTIDKYQKPESLMELLSRNDEKWPLKLSSLSRICFSRLFSKLSEIDSW